MEASKLIDQQLASLCDWRGDTMRTLRALILAVDPAIVEEWKWMGTAVWNRDGILLCINPHKTVVKATFLKGASLPDPRGLFNAELEGNARRAIKWEQSDAIDHAGFQDLVRAAIALNASKPAARRPDQATRVRAKKKALPEKNEAPAKLSKAPAKKNALAKKNAPAKKK